MDLKLTFKLTKNNIIIISIFLLALILRALPELLNPNYAVGYDTPFYAYIIDYYSLHFDQINNLFSWGSPLFLYIAVVIKKIANIPSFLLLKILASVLHGSLGVVSYLFSRSSLKWGCKKSLLVSILITFHFIAQRISWDLYRNQLGIIFLFLYLISINKHNKINSFFLSILMTLSHQMVGIVGIFISIYFVFKEFYFDKKINIQQIFIAIVIVITLWLSNFVFGYSGMPFSRPILTSVIANPTEPFTDYLSNDTHFSLFLKVMTLFLFSYGVMFPLILLGNFKNDSLRSWTICLLIGSFSCLIFPNFGIFLWRRWMFMLIFPFAFYSINGLKKIHIMLESKIQNSLRILKRHIMTVFMVIILLSGLFYSTGIIFFYGGLANEYIPSSMIESSIAPNDVQSTITSMKWLNNEMNQNSCVIMSSRFLGWALLNLDENKVIITYEVNTNKIDESLNIALEKGFDEIYLINYPKWYPYPIDELKFDSVFQSNNVYIYNYTGSF